MHEKARLKPLAWISNRLRMFVCPRRCTRTHATGFVEKRERTFPTLAAEPQQTQAACAANAPTIAVHRVAGVRMLLPVASPRSGSEM